MGSSGDDFQAENLDSFVNVIGLTSNDPLNGFGEIWYQVFVWALVSSFFVHAIASFIGFFRLRKHKLGRWIPLVVLAMGILSPITGGAVTSAAIAGVYRASGFTMAPFYALVWGVGQTIVMVFISFTRILATL
ncbi:transmembrane protein 170A-like [Liolophura sinensis]|uniref:transmembrane protein 170A-like n=1 Tax=Liolophura sinensis TaxID=3198878 RepID=UPI0031597F68